MRWLGCILISCLFCIACNMQNKKPYPGPDKQGEGMIYGAMMGAGSGAVMGFQTSAGSGPGALAGMGFGAVFGMLSGLGLDVIEETSIENSERIKELRDEAWAQEMLNEHYMRRLELHPNRDIFPADWFFADDGTSLSCRGLILINEIARLNKSRMPWSRLLIAVYSTSSEPESIYAKRLTQKRGEALSLAFVRAGIEPRRVSIRPLTLPDAILIDPYDSPNRYKQAVEIIALDY